MRCKRHMGMKIYIAPVQGHTDAAWRYFHNKTYGGNHRFFTPFIRCDHGEIRPKDLRDFNNPMNKEIGLEPQVIFRDIEELKILLHSLADNRANSVNLNMGCPFPLQTHKGRGAAFIANITEAQKLPDLLAGYSDIKFSVKMRLGMEQPDEWKEIIRIFNSIELDKLYIHPRVARQQYGGSLHLDSFTELLDESKNPVVFNGDIRTPEDIRRIASKFPKINGVMVARGILARPSLASEFEGDEWDREKRLEIMMQFHHELFGFYKNTLCGDSQILSKIKPFWEFAEEEIGRKPWKAIKKSTSIVKYNSAVASIK